MEFRIVRGQLHGLSITFQREIQVTVPNVERASILMGIEVVGLELNRAAKTSLGIVRSEGVPQGIAEVIEGDRKVRVDLERLIVGVDRFLIAMEVMECDPKKAPGIGVLRELLRDLTIDFFRSLNLSGLMSLAKPDSRWHRRLP